MAPDADYLRGLSFSAVCLFYGEQLQEELGGLPVGLVDTSWGGTIIGRPHFARGMEERRKLYIYDLISTG